MSAAFVHRDIKLVIKFLSLKQIFIRIISRQGKVQMFQAKSKKN